MTIENDKKNSLVSNSERDQKDITNNEEEKIEDIAEEIINITDIPKEEDN